MELELDEAIEVLNDITRQVKVKSDGVYQTYKGMCACMLAIDSLEKQIPKKPVHDGCFDSDGMWHEWNGINGRPYDLCPNCNTNLCCEMPCDSKPNYCSKCGCRLDCGDG